MIYKNFCTFGLQSTLFFHPLKRTDMDSFKTTLEERIAYLEHRVGQLSRNEEALTEQVWTLTKRLDKNNENLKHLKEEADRARTKGEEAQKQIEMLSQKLEQASARIDALERTERIERRALGDCIHILEDYPPEQNTEVREIIGFLHKLFKNETPEEHECLSRLDLKRVESSIQFHAPLYDVNGNREVHIIPRVDNK